MRFEIRAGGALIIVAGVVGLSCAVFGLGLVAGYEMAKQNQPDIDQISTAYPLASPGAEATTGGAAPIAAISPYPGAIPSVASGGALPPPVPIPSAAWQRKPRNSASLIGSVPTQVAAKRMHNAVAPRAIDTSAEDEDEDSASDSESSSAIPPPPVMPPSNKRGFNIQVEAVMDRSGADSMVARLRSLGYNAQEYQTVLGGQVWYRVRVGPYYSQEEAAAAQAKLRDQYRQAYTTSH